MSVNNVTGVGRVVLPNKAARSTDTSASASAAEPSGLVQVDEATQQPIPPRFPWLSRLQKQLEPASKQPSPYGSAPLLGEKLDRQA